MCRPEERTRRRGRNGATVRLKADTTYVHAMHVHATHVVATRVNATQVDATPVNATHVDATDVDATTVDAMDMNPTYVVSGFSRTWWGILAVAVLLASTAAPAAQSPKYHVGRPPTEEDTRALGIMVAPDGTGLPAGSGTAVQGKEVFTARCASCHGQKGEGGDGPALVGGKGTLATPTPKRTVGSYWPYATTVWDYVNRAMPFNQPGTLSHDEVYAVAAYVLFLNDIVGEKQVLDARSLPLIRMPNRDGFVPDPRPDVRSKNPSE